jgi:hypothetical protein
MVKENRKILVIIDHCPCHPELNLSNIKVVFLPLSITSVAQPMDQGVIKCFKTNYRKRVVRRLLREMELNPRLNVEQTKINLLEAINIVAVAWDEVSSSTFKNCFTKAGFPANKDVEVAEVIEDNELDALWSNLAEKLDLNGTTFADFADIDYELAVVQERSNE